MKARSRLSESLCPRPKNIPHPHAELLKTKSCGVVSQSGFRSALNLGVVPPLRFIQNGCAQRLICIRINSWLPQPLHRPRQGRADCDWITFSSLSCHRSICRSCLCLLLFLIPLISQQLWHSWAIPWEKTSLFYCGNWLILLHWSLDKSFSSPISSPM